MWKDKTWPDDWTAVTSDGKRSAQARIPLSSPLLSSPNNISRNIPPHRGITTKHTPGADKVVSLVSRQFEHTMILNNETGEVELLTARPAPDTLHTKH